MCGEWWVPGGRVFKGETLEAAFHRKMREELGIGVKILAPVGYYEQHPETSRSKGDGTHAVSVVFCALPLSLDIILDAQSATWRFADQLPPTFRVVHFGGWLTS
jgi:colanic acid biosynthesis protein WcaH